MLLILSPKTSPRLDYVCHVIFERVLGLDFSITEDEEKYKAYTDFKLRYMPKSELLFETDIRKQDEELLLQDKPALAFYLLSNYEEYLPDCLRDQHGRIVHEQSFVERHQLHKQATVQRIALEYKILLSKQKPNYQWKVIFYRFIPTFDIDIAYAFKGKHGLHFWGALAKAVLTLQWNNARQIIKARQQQDFQDPYDVYDIEKQLCEQHQLRPIYFILTSNRTRFDRNISPHSSYFSALVQKLKTYATIGLHPSYHSENQNNIIKEKKTLEEKGQVKIQYSRQHFLKVKFPDTFRNLITAGITDDFSLGFYDHIGFRNGMALPFPFFDVKENKTTKLMLHPLLMMDSAAVQELGMDEKYQKGIDELIQEVKNVGGDMIALWHSNFMPQGSKELELFKNIFERMGRVLKN
ncbi:MAG: hypothetical protein J5644_01545 [Bacteroidales bacterium]|nr:hypothetical protein [Bacteroidales bacterium]